MSKDEGVRRRLNPSKTLLPHEEPDDPDWPYAHGNLDPLGKFIGIAVMVICFSLIAYFRYRQYLRDMAITPLDVATIIDANATLPSISPDRFWGTYRPHTYFGLKTQTPESPLFGAMWLMQITGQTPSLRHWCDESDDLLSYGWRMHDGKSFGVQELEEKAYTVKTEFVKRPGGDHGGDWTARITMTPKTTQQEMVVSGFFYVALNGQGYLQPVLSDNVLTEVIGTTKELGSFQLKFPTAAAPTKKSSYLVSSAASLTNLSNLVRSSMHKEAWDKLNARHYLSLGGHSVLKHAPEVNFIVKEVTATLPLQMEMVFESGSVASRHEPLQGEAFDSALKSCIKTFDIKFSNTFQLERKGYTEKELQVAKSCLSNLLGSVGYFYGNSLVMSQFHTMPENYWKSPLLTGVPSRSFFPRGFLWDEGFHNLLISRWDQALSLEILGHWLDLMNTEGWIPGEQILGAEARAKVSSQFVVQHNNHANPPTFFLPLKRLIHEMTDSQTASDQQYLEALFPRLEAWYTWYKNTPVVSAKSAFRWRGRNTNAVTQFNPLVYMSGLNDYPRASHPSVEERNVDLWCWMALASGIMGDIAKSTNRTWQEYADTHQLLMDNNVLDTLHWSEDGQQYSDYGLHTDEIKLEKPVPLSHLAENPMPGVSEMRASITEPRYQFVNTFGYISLFPFFLKIVGVQSP